MKLLLLGAEGQLGRELTRTLASLGEVRALARRDADLTDLDALQMVIRTSDANVIVNAAAYTRVEAATSEPELAFRVNGEAPRTLAAEAARSRALLVHFSTDYVFDGRIRRPYREDDAPAPLNVYGASKLEGDNAVLDSDAPAFVFRVEWVYSLRGKNFLTRIQELARQRDELTVVDDQHGSPTWTRSIADATTDVISRWISSQRGDTPPPAPGLYHMAPPDYTTWFGFAKAIIDSMEFSAGEKAPAVRAIATSEYPTATERPLWSVLDSGKLYDTFRLKLPSWRDQLHQCLTSAP